jgi:hypothetical protein
MLSVSVYRQLLRLYPAPHRRQFGEEMIAVFGDIRSDAASRGAVARIVFYIRESAGLIAGAMQEHWRRLGGDPDVLWFSPRRATMHTEFRFPKTTAVLMTIILAGLVLAIKKGETISSSNVNPPIGPLPPTHSVLLGGHLSNPRILLCRGVDWVGDSVRDAAVGSASPGGHRCRNEIVSPVGRGGVGGWKESRSSPPRFRDRPNLLRTTPAYRLRGANQNPAHP